MSVLTLGETMALFDPARDGTPSPGMPYTLRFAGAESNYAIALARLGIAVRWASRVGADPIGEVRQVEELCVAAGGARRIQGIDAIDLGRSQPVERVRQRETRLHEGGNVQ